MSLIEIQLPTPDSLDEIGRLRVLAWKSTQPKFRELDVWLDDTDLTARHWVIRLDDRIVAAARLSMHSSVEQIPDAELFRDLESDLIRSPIASLNRLVVHPEFQGRGLSMKLDRIRIEAADVLKSGCVVGVCRDPRRVMQLERFGLVSLASVEDPHPMFDRGMVTIVARAFDRNQMNKMITASDS